MSNSREHELGCNKMIFIMSWWVKVLQKLVNIYADCDFSFLYIDILDNHKIIKQ